MNIRKGGENNACFSSQRKTPARVIVIDATSSRSSDIFEAFSIALSEFITLHHLLPGTPKISLFGLYVIGSYAECVIHLQSVQQNMEKIRSSIDTLKFYGNINDTTGNMFQESFNVVLMESFAKLQEFLKTASKAINIPSQIDFCVFTSQKQNYVEKDIARVLQENDVALIKKIQVVHVSTSNSMDIESSNDSTGSADNGTTEILCSYVESLYIENNSICFDQFFKSWLQENGSDDVNLIIQFSGFDIKCDLLHTMINPLAFPNGKAMILESELSNHALSTTTTSKTKQQQQQLPNVTYSMSLKQLMKSENVCESIIFGTPMILKPTTCWKLDWEELEKNQNHFFSLMAYLKLQDMCMIMERIEQCLKSYYIILPSSGSTMLIKSIVSREIMMPLDKTLDTNISSHPIDPKIEDALEQIEVCADYNPFMFSSGLLINKKQQPKKQKTQRNPSQTTSTSIFNSFDMENNGENSMWTATPRRSNTYTSSSVGNKNESMVYKPKENQMGSPCTNKVISNVKQYNRENEETITVSPYYVKQPKRQPLFKKQQQQQSLVLTEDNTIQQNIANEHLTKPKKRYVPRFTSLPKPVPVTNAANFSQNIVFKNNTNMLPPPGKKKKFY